MKWLPELLSVSLEGLSALGLAAHGEASRSRMDRMIGRTIATASPGIWDIRCGRSVMAIPLRIAFLPTPRNDDQDISPSAWSASGTSPGLHRDNCLVLSLQR